MGIRRLLATSVLLGLTGCGMPYGNQDDDGWRPLGAGSPIVSSGGTFGRSLPPGSYGSQVTVPRLTGAQAAPGVDPGSLREEDGNIWPAPEAPRPMPTDPTAVTQGVPAFRPDAARSPPIFRDPPPSGLPRNRTPGSPGFPGSPGSGDRSAVPLPRPTPGAALRPDGRTPGPGDIIRRFDGQPAVTGAGSDGVWTYEVPGRPGVGTAIPDGRGGRLLLEPGGRTIPVPR